MEQKKLHARLRAARIARQLSLRDVATLTDHQISNPYLCQLETGKNAEPSPHKLRLLAKVLRLDFLELMILAGYITVKDLKGRV